MYLKRSEVLLINPNLILTPKFFFHFEGWSLVLCTRKQFVKLDDQQSDLSLISKYCGHHIRSTLLLASSARIITSHWLANLTADDFWFVTVMAIRIIACCVTASKQILEVRNEFRVMLLHIVSFTTLFHFSKVSHGWGKPLSLNLPRQFLLKVLV